MEKVVTTFPITIRPEISKARMQGVIAGGLLAHHIGADFIAWMGLNGRTADTSTESQQLFYTAAQAYGLKNKTHIMNDTSSDFVRFVRDSTETLVENGHLALGENEQLVCECGIVHIEKSATKEIRIDKLKNIKQHLGVLACKHCESALTSKKSIQITTTPSLYESLHKNANIFPQQSVRAKVNSTIQEASQRKKIITRTDRSQGILFQNNGLDFILDPDFTLQLTPSYNPGEVDTILLSGPRQIERVVGSMALFKTLEIQSNPISLLHPRIVLHPDSALLSSPISMNPQDIIQSTLITASTLLWSRHESKLSESDYKMLTRMSAQLAGAQIEQSKILARPARENSIESFMQLYSPQRIRSVLKSIRRGEISPNSDEATLLSDIQKL